MIPSHVPSNRPTTDPVLDRVVMKNTDNASFVEYFATSVAICDELIFSPGNKISETSTVTGIGTDDVISVRRKLALRTIEFQPK